MTDIIRFLPATAAKGETVESLNAKREAARKAMRRAKQAEVKAEKSGWGGPEERAMWKAEEEATRLWDEFDGAMRVKGEEKAEEVVYSENLSIEEAQEVSHYE